MRQSIVALADPQVLPPELTVFVLGALTQLADGWFVVFLFAFVLWRFPERRPEVVVVIAATLLTVGVYGALKHLIAIPRPEQALVDTIQAGGQRGWLLTVLASAEGYRFPSGHASTATTVYVGLASALRVGTRLQRYAAAAGIVVLVAFTRVALIVHHAVDVVAGTALGLAMLGGSLLLAQNAPDHGATPVLGCSIAASIAYATVSGGEIESIALLGVCGAAFVAWVLAGPSWMPSVVAEAEAET